MTTKTTKEREFQQGMIAAATIVMHAYGRDTIARNILIACGVHTSQDLKSSTKNDFDLQVLLPILEEHA